MFDDVAAVSSRLKVTEIACNFFRSIVALTPEDLLPTIYLCTSKVAPAYEGLEVGIGDASLVKAIAEATGRSVAQIKSDAEKSGFVAFIVTVPTVSLFFRCANFQAIWERWRRRADRIRARCSLLLR